MAEKKRGPILSPIFFSMFSFRPPPFFLAQTSGDKVRLLAQINQKRKSGGDGHGTTASFLSNVAHCYMTMTVVW